MQPASRSLHARWRLGLPGALVFGLLTSALISGCVGEETCVGDQSCIGLGGSGNGGGFPPAGSGSLTGGAATSGGASAGGGATSSGGVVATSGTTGVGGVATGGSTSTGGFVGGAGSPSAAGTMSGGTMNGGSPSAAGTMSGGSPSAGGTTSGGSPSAGGPTNGGTTSGTAGSAGSGMGGSGSVDPYAEARQKCVDRVNQLRSTKGKGPLTRLPSAEDCADGQAKKDSETGKAHSAFGDCVNEVQGWTGAAQNECPGWGSVADTLAGCIDAMWAEGPGGGHYDNMVGDSDFIACGFYTTPAGKVWMIQDFWSK